ncbi:unnamed protein product [Porites evermanni]|uniref:J domain-containing protein n=1 Tax=Porites evermanni TaxID=104178 RepID=A0ABN8R9P4_9CNID|nr:unnamed protein product [Porites evermanni]
MEDLCDVLGDKNKQDDYYSLLGCDELATTEQINAEFRQKAKECHPDKNSGDQAAKKLFERLKQARNTLCNEEGRKKYDKWRKSGIAVPYEQWLELSGAVHTSLHWAAKPRKELMLDWKKSEEKNLDECLNEEENAKHRRLQSPCVSIQHCARPPRRCGWSSMRGTHISKFRKYEI